MNKHSTLPNADFFKTYLTLVMDRRALSLQEAIDFMFESYFCKDFTLFGLQTKQQFELAIQQLISKK